MQNIKNLRGPERGPGPGAAPQKTDPETDSPRGPGPETGQPRTEAEGAETAPPQLDIYTIYTIYIYHLPSMTLYHGKYSLNENPAVFEARVRASDEQQQQQGTKYVCPVLGLTPPPPISAPCLAWAAAILAGDWPMHWSIDQEKLSIAS